MTTRVRATIELSFVATSPTQAEVAMRNITRAVDDVELTEKTANVHYETMTSFEFTDNLSL